MSTHKSSTRRRRICMGSMYTAVNRSITIHITLDECIALRISLVCLYVVYGFNLYVSVGCKHCICNSYGNNQQQSNYWIQCL